MTVLPVRSTRAPPGGAGISPFLPTLEILSFSIRNAESSMGALPSPTMSLAPSNRIGPPLATSGGFFEEHAPRTKSKHRSRPIGNRPQDGIPPPLLSRQMFDIAIVFIADKFKQFGLRQQMHIFGYSPWLGVRFGIVNRDLNVQMPKVFPPESLDHVESVAGWPAHLIQPRLA